MGSTRCPEWPPSWRSMRRGIPPGFRSSTAKGARAPGARPSPPCPSPPGAAAPKARPERQRVNLEGALAVASSLVMDASSNDGDVIPGQTFQATVSLYDAGAAPVIIDSLSLAMPEGWRAVVDSGAGGVGP